MSYSDLMREARGNVAKRDEAITAARERGSGRGSEEVRSILIEEYTSRGLRVPHEAALEIVVDSIVNPGVLNAAGRAVQMLTGLGRQARGIVGLFGKAERIKGPHGGDAYFVPPDHTRPMVEVILDPAAREVLRAAGRGRSGSDGEFMVWLDGLTSESSEPLVVSVTTEGGRIGTLSADDSRAYEYALRKAEASGGTLTVLAKCHEDPDGRLSVRVFPAGTAWWS